MARPRQKNIVERLADAGEEAIQRIGSAPGGDRLLGALGSMRERVDDLQKRVRGLENLDKRLGAVERRLDKLEGKGKSTSRKTSSRAAKRTTARKPGSSSPS
jgi:hypothetical protein